MYGITGKGAKVVTTIAQRRLPAAQNGKLLNHPVKSKVLVEGPWLTPQRFSHRPIYIASAREALLGAIVETWDAGQGEQASGAQGNLVIKCIGIAGVAIIKAPRLIMIVQEGHKKVAGIAMRAEYVVLHLLAKRIGVHHVAGRELAFCHAREFVEKWEVERSIDAYNVACF